MEVLSHFALGKIAGCPNPPFPSVRMAELFYEFLRRYNEWKTAKHQEMIWLAAALSLGLLGLLIPLILPSNWILMSVAVLGSLYFVIRHYLEINKRVIHLQVNVHILHHHLMGKLEVGFCNHAEPCQCVEKFCSYVLRRYGISLDKNL